MSAFTGISRRNETMVLRNWSGRLFASFNPKTDKNSETGTTLKVSGFSIKGDIGSDVPYARIHDLGGTIANGWGRGIKINMPKRPYFTPGMKKLEQNLDLEIKRFLEKNLQEIINKEFTAEEFAQKIKASIIPMLNDLKDRIPFTAQGYIGSEMKNISVNPAWKGVKGG